jgi:amino-acid N-acetyltransferase
LIPAEWRFLLTSLVSESLGFPPTLEVPRLNIRPARVSDVPGIHQLVGVFADKKLMIRRTMAELYESIREFCVAVDEENHVIGCAALHVFWEDLAEIRCLAVAEHLQGLGVGRRLVDDCWSTARDFFLRCGYRIIEKTELPHGIWGECVRCPAFPECKEVAVARTHEDAPAQLALARHGWAASSVPDF